MRKYSSDDPDRTPATFQSRRGLSRRAFLKALGVSAAGLLAAGCQPEIAPTTSAPAFTPTPAVTLDPNAPPPTVAIAQATDYDPKLIRQKVQELLDGIGGLGDVIRPGDSVAIKVNLTGGTRAGSVPGVSPVESFATHPMVYQALGEAIRDAGAKNIFVVESIWDPASYSAWGFQNASNIIGASLVDLNLATPYPDYGSMSVGANSFIFPTFMFNRILQEIDVFVSIGKMKCHYLCGVTHSMKNLIGIAPLPLYRRNPGDGTRTALHGSDEEVGTRLPRVVVDLNRARPIHLSLIDGIKTVEGGEGPWLKIAPVNAGVLLAGKNPLATDSVATAIMGFDPTASRPTAPFLRADNYLALAASLGLGTNQISQIKVVGTPIADVRKPFKPSEEQA